MKQCKFIFAALSILLLLTKPSHSQMSDYTCQQPDSSALQVWNPQPQSHTIEWRIDLVCSTYRGCYGYQSDADPAPVAQLCPVAIQDKDLVFLNAPPRGSPYKVKPVNASREQFIKCPVSSDQRLYSEEISLDLIEVPSEYLISGKTTYLAQTSNGPFSNCTFGLRVQIMVRDNHRCLSSSIKSSESSISESLPLCSGNGQCVTTLLDTDYFCVCNNTHIGELCEIETLCIGGPCSTGSTCVPQGNSSFSCLCPPTRTGKLCDRLLETCATKQCLNGGYCISNTDGVPICHCPPGWTEGDCNTLENPCVTQNPCNPGQICVDTSTPLQPGTFSCTCPIGYEGDFCEIDIDECSSSPCQNEGTCSQGLGYFNCTCPLGFEGVICEQDISICDHQVPCHNDATCVDGVGFTFTCVCLPGYTGSHCETEVDECDMDPCQNGGTCTDLIGRFQCDCFPQYYGATCELQNGCFDQTCENGGYCQKVGDGDYFCLCAQGYTGMNCQDEVDECENHSCEHGATCVDLLGSYRCECEMGYTGDHCETDINECDNVHCNHGGTCMDLVGRYTCVCRPGFTGIFCETNIDNCEPDPCVNGICVDKVAGYRCYCDNGFMGDNCDEEINECLDAKCVKSNTDYCEDGHLTFTCVCKPGFTGELCELDSCSVHECQNNATCVTTGEKYRCECLPGYSGEFCETETHTCHSNPCHGGFCVAVGEKAFNCMCPSDKYFRDEFCQILHPCEAEPCKNGANCSGDIRDYTFTCECAPGFRGDTCEEQIRECQEWNITCEHGLCFDATNDFICGCQPGYTGRYCEINIDDCLQNECQNNSVCVDEVESYSCDCQVGFSGRYCNETYSHCSEEPCQNGATCITVTATTRRSAIHIPGSLGGGSNVDFSNANPDTFKCECAEGFEGVFCEKNIDDCDPHLCKHGGTCLDGVNSFTCICASGFTGSNCKQNIDDCGSHQCQNNGTCKDLVNRYRCICPPEFTGEYCEVDVDECASNPCQNSGICVDDVGRYKCYCRNGFTGTHCENDYNECLSSPCLNNGNCTEGVGSFTCTCDTGWSGLTCEMNINECSSSPCYNGATCSDRINGFDCNCPEGYSGKRCEIEIDECESSPCQNDGSCRDMISGYICDCPRPYTGSECQLLPCDLNPCGNHGDCTNELALLPHGFVCTCSGGYTGLRCQSNIDDCVSAASAVEGGACSGRGFCVDLENAYKCYCDPGWKGQDCELPIDQCTGQDRCRNGGTCVNRPDGFMCECTPGWDGEFCERNYDDCESSPCRFDATCVDLFNDYQCLCSPGWIGKQCTEQINECLTNPCGNQATCVDLVNNFTCLCPPLYTGRLCESAYDPCASETTQCQHSATCSVASDGTYSCDCAPGYTGVHCEVDVNECDLDPCVNAAPCEDLVNGFLCHCQPGFTGDTCSVNIDDCETHSCQNNATCKDLTNGYYCECLDGWTGLYCQEEVNECSSDPCQNNAECEDLNNGYKCHCPPSYTGVNCEESVDQCTPNPCVHNSVCKPVADSGYTCYCAVGYQGDNCKTEIDECDYNPCLGNGDCTDLVNDYTCTCHAGWSGRNCSENIDECVSSPCQNNATCVDGVNGYTCICVQGYAGMNCELEFDHCDPNPCLHDGTCQYLENSFTCDCLPGTTGYQCETDLNECESNPCEDRGICREFKAGYGFMCLCNPGLGGDLCELNYDDCTPNPCHNGATCQDLIDSFSCICTDGFTGDHCEVQYNTTEPPTTVPTASRTQSEITPSSSPTSPPVTSMNVTFMHETSSVRNEVTSVVDGNDLLSSSSTVTSSLLSTSQGEGHLSSLKVTSDHQSQTTDLMSHGQSSQDNSQPGITTRMSYSSSSDVYVSLVESSVKFSGTTGEGDFISRSSEANTDSSLSGNTFSTSSSELTRQYGISTDKTSALTNDMESSSTVVEMVTSSPGPIDETSGVYGSSVGNEATKQPKTNSEYSTAVTSEMMTTETPTATLITSDVVNTNAMEISTGETTEQGNNVTKSKTTLNDVTTRHLAYTTSDDQETAGTFSTEKQTDQTTLVNHTTELSAGKSTNYVDNTVSETSEGSYETETQTSMFLTLGDETVSDVPDTTVAVSETDKTNLISTLDTTVYEEKTSVKDTKDYTTASSEFEDTGSTLVSSTYEDVSTSESKVAYTSEPTSVMETNTYIQTSTSESTGSILMSTSEAEITNTTEHLVNISRDINTGFSTSEPTTKMTEVETGVSQTSEDLTSDITLTTEIRQITTSNNMTVTAEEKISSTEASMFSTSAMSSSETTELGMSVTSTQGITTGITTGQSANEVSTDMQMTKSVTESSSAVVSTTYERVTKLPERTPMANETGIQSTITTEDSLSGVNITTGDLAGSSSDTNTEQLTITTETIVASNSTTGLIGGDSTLVKTSTEITGTMSMSTTVNELTQLVQNTSVKSTSEPMTSTAENVEVSINASTSRNFETSTQKETEQLNDTTGMSTYGTDVISHLLPNDTTTEVLNTMPETTVNTSTIEQQPSSTVGVTDAVTPFESTSENTTGIISTITSGLTNTSVTIEKRSSSSNFFTSRTDSIENITASYLDNSSAVTTEPFYNDTVHNKTTVSVTNTETSLPPVVTMTTASIHNQSVAMSTDHVTVVNSTSSPLTSSPSTEDLYSYTTPAMITDRNVTTGDDLSNNVSMVSSSQNSPDTTVATVNGENLTASYTVTATPADLANETSDITAEISRNETDIVTTGMLNVTEEDSTETVTMVPSNQTTHSANETSDTMSTVIAKTTVGVEMTTSLPGHNASEGIDPTSSTILANSREPVTSEAYMTEINSTEKYTEIFNQTERTTEGYYTSSVVSESNNTAVINLTVITTVMEDITTNNNQINETTELPNMTSNITPEATTGVNDSTYHVSDGVQPVTTVDNTTDTELSTLGYVSESVSTPVIDSSTVSGPANATNMSDIWNVTDTDTTAATSFISEIQHYTTGLSSNAAENWTKNFTRDSESTFTSVSSLMNVTEIVPTSTTDYSANTTGLTSVEESSPENITTIMPTIAISYNASTVPTVENITEIMPTNSTPNTIEVTTVQTSDGMLSTDSSNYSTDVSGNIPEVPPVTDIVTDTVPTLAINETTAMLDNTSDVSTVGNTTETVSTVTETTGNSENMITSDNVGETTFSFDETSRLFNGTDATVNVTELLVINATTDAIDNLYNVTAFQNTSQSVHTIPTTMSTGFENVSTFDSVTEMTISTTPDVTDGLRNSTDSQNISQSLSTPITTSVYSIGNNTFPENASESLPTMTTTSGDSFDNVSTVDMITETTSLLNITVFIDNINDGSKMQSDTVLSTRTTDVTQNQTLSATSSSLQSETGSTEVTTMTRHLQNETDTTEITTTFSSIQNETETTSIPSHLQNETTIIPGHLKNETETTRVLDHTVTEPSSFSTEEVTSQSDNTSDSLTVSAMSQTSHIVTEDPNFTPSPDSLITDSSAASDQTTSLEMKETTTSSSEPVTGSCDESTCQNGGVCVNISNDGAQGYRCECSIKYYGSQCQFVHSFSELSFNGNGYLAFPAPVVASDNMIEISFQTIQEEGLLLYAAKDLVLSNPMHFIKLYIEEGILKYSFSCEVETFTINTLIRVNTGQMFNITIQQSNQCKAFLSIEAETIAHQTTEQGLTDTPVEFLFTTLQRLFIGGVPSHVTQQQDVISNLIGCVSLVAWNGDLYNISQAENGQNVEQCSQEPFPTSPLTPHPTCADINCLNGGTCQNVATPSGGIRYQCNCPIHFAGTRCEEEIVVFFPRFSGNSYLQYNAIDLNGPSNNLYLTFKTSHTDGTLMYTADESGKFIHLFIEEGILKFQMTCGMSGIIYMNSQTSVDIDQLVAVQLRWQVSELDQMCFVSMAIDDNDTRNSTLYTSIAPVSMAPSNLYLGGAPVSIATVSQATPFTGFTGCIRHLQVNEEELRVFHDATTGVNIARCEVNACNYQPCMNGGSCEDTGESWYCECMPGYTGTYCERDTCHFQPCEHGGTCLHLEDTGNYLCLCPYGRHGINCSQSISVFRPSFNGIQYGYPSFMAYPRMRAIDHVIDIRFSFSLAKDEELNKNASESSLMIYTGQKGDGSQGSDFLVVGLEAHHIVFRFDCGSGMAEVRSLYPINSQLSVHKVELGRNKKLGWLRIDGQAEVMATSPGTLTGLNVDSMFYVGGHDYYGNTKHMLPEGASFMNTFHGCIFDLEVRASRYGEWSVPGQVTSGRNVQQCDQSQCELNICQNGGTCVDLGASYGCKCSAGYYGQLCTDLTSVCDGNHSCIGDSVCVPLSEGGYVCDCPLGKTGEYCDQEIAISDPSFIGERSYMAFHTPRNIRENLDIKVQFKSTKSSGLLLYMAETLSERTSDFLSVELVDWLVVLRYNTGSENPTVLTSENKADHGFGADYWYTLYIGRNISHAYLNLDGKEVTSIAEPGMTNLDISTLVYLGGLPDLSVVSPYAVTQDVVTFEGCVRELVVNHVEYRLDNTGAVEGLNVADCDGTRCGFSTCENGGTCQLNGTGSFTCQCVEPYTGITCSESVYCINNQCDADSVCLPHEVQKNYSCLCPLGKAGFYCDQDITINIPYFSGSNTYMYLHDNPDIDASVTDMAFSFLTVESEGMILWNGEVYSDKDDYLGVGIHNGRLQVLISLGWWDRDELSSLKTVNDGFWHTVEIQRDGRVLTLIVDGVMSVASISGSFSELNTYGHFYLGGFEHGDTVYDKTNGHFSSMYVGALANLRLYRETNLVDWKSTDIQGSNIVDYLSRET